MSFSYPQVIIKLHNKEHRAHRQRWVQNNNMVIMAVYDLPDYSGFIHSFTRFSCKLSTALGQILLVSKMDVGKSIWIVIVINQHEQWDLWFTFIFLETIVWKIHSTIEDCGQWCTSLMFCRTVKEAVSASLLVSPLHILLFYFY